MFKGIIGKVKAFFGKNSEAKETVKAFREYKFIPIVFRAHSPRELTDDERAAKIAHRKKIKRNKRLLINRRGYA